MPVKKQTADGGMVSKIDEYLKKDSKIVDNPLWITMYVKTNPDELIKVYRDIIKAGVDIVRTNTYQGSVQGIMKTLNFTEREAKNLIIRSVELIREAIRLEEKEQGKPLNIEIVGCIGSYGAFLHDGSEYKGFSKPLSQAELREWHRPRLEAFLEAGLTSVSCDTIPTSEEALALITLLKEHPPLTAVWISFSVKDNIHIGGGEILADVCALCWKEAQGRVRTLGVNCLPVDVATQSLKSVHEAHPEIPLYSSTNISKIFDSELRQWVDANNKDPLEKSIEDWFSLGVQIVGGCCTSTIDHMAIINKKVQAWNKKNIKC